MMRAIPYPKRSTADFAFFRTGSLHFSSGHCKLWLSFLLIVFVSRLFAQNPLISGQFTADPTARVFGDRVYVYPSHDILGTKDHGQPGWFNMEDYHVFSSQNLTDWTDHGVIVSQTKVPWVNPKGYSMWAPDCVFKNGKYYFYFPSQPKDTASGRRFAIGVAISDQPTGPFVPMPEPIKNVHGIDPNVFIDNDGVAYLYWSQGNIYAARLNENMTELASDPVILQDLPNKGLKEGPFMFKRNNIYYLTYPHVANKIERLEYATGDNPLGPFKTTGVIMDESPTGCWTNHHSILQYQNQWYLFYHHNDYSPDFDKARSIRADSLSFNADGTIQKVVPTLRGIGITSAKGPVQIDRYSAISNSGVSIAFLDTANKFMGWKAVFEQAGSWVQYNTVQFKGAASKAVKLRAMSTDGGAITVRLDNQQGRVLASVPVPKGADWRVVKATIKNIPAGVHNLLVESNTNGRVAVDWISFE